MKIRFKPRETDAISVRDIVNQSIPGAGAKPLPSWVQQQIDAGKIIVRKFDLVVRTPYGIFDAGYLDFLVHDDGDVLVVNEKTFVKTYEILGEAECATAI